MWTGDLDAAAGVAEEAARLAAATHGAANPHMRMQLAAWRGDEAATLRLCAEIRASYASGSSTLVFLADYAEAVLFNGTGRFAQAHAAARRLFDAGQLPMGTLVASELADAASRSGAVEDLRRLDAWLRERVHAAPSPWVIGVAERVRALLSENSDAEAHYLDSIEQLRKTRSRTELARSELMFGEWLRRQGRRGDARHALREAWARFREIGAGAFTERAVRALRATGDPCVAGAAFEHGALTAQEAQIAALAAEGLTNPEIGACLFISGRTVQYYLRKVFVKLGITSRTQLPRAAARA
jgi:DNA-binding CsgD family transcriptional regulator